MVVKLTFPNEIYKLTKLVEVFVVIFSDRGSIPLSSTKYEKVAPPRNHSDYKGVALNKYKTVRNRLLLKKASIYFYVARDNFCAIHDNYGDDNYIVIYIPDVEIIDTIEDVISSNSMSNKQVKILTRINKRK